MQTETTFQRWVINAFGSIPYTVIIGAVCQLILFGSVDLLNYITLIKYALGFSLTMWFPTAKLALKLQPLLFPRAKGAVREWTINLCFALIFEFVFGFIINLAYTYVLPGAHFNLGQAMWELLITYPGCVVADVLISTYLLHPMHNLARFLLGMSKEPAPQD